MSKIAICCAALAVSLTAGMTISQAREINAFGSTFTVDDGPAVALPAPATQRFNAAVSHPERYSRNKHHVIDLDRLR